MIYQRVAAPHWENLVRALIEEHRRETQSRFAERLLADWRLEMPSFWQVVPKEMLNRLDQPLDAGAQRRA